MPLLIKIGLAHAQFETIHPFLDGNGRMGRLLITFLLCQSGTLQRPLLYLSYYFKQHRQEYYDYLQRVRDAGDWESWLKFFLRGVYQVAQEATHTAREIVQLRERHRAIIMEEFKTSAGPALKLLEALYERPVITNRNAVEFTGRKFPNASRVVSKFEELHILQEVTRKARNRQFMYVEYFDLFDREAPLSDQ